MQVKLLSHVRNSIPYMKELRPIFGSPLGCILGQQLDYWFEKYPKGFYKFMQPAPDRTDYREGDSWEEELGFSAKEFRTAFDFFGVRHKSSSEYRAAENPFLKKDGTIASFCSVFNRRTGQTRYFRNHEYLDGKLQRLLFTVNAQREVTVSAQQEFIEMPTGSLHKCPSGSSVNADRAVPYTDPTSEPTTDPTSKEKEMIAIDIPLKKTESPAPDESGMPEPEKDNSGEVLWKKWKRAKGKGSKRNFLTAWNKLSQKTKALAAEHYDKRVIYFREWRNGEDGVPWPENFVKRKYWTHEIDFDSLIPESGNAQQTGLSRQPVDNRGNQRSRYPTKMERDMDIIKQEMADIWKEEGEQNGI